MVGRSQSSRSTEASGKWAHDRYENSRESRSTEHSGKWAHDRYEPSRDSRSTTEYSGKWARDRNENSRDADPDVDGVELKMVCKGVPVLTVDKSSPFYEHASWMLQSALESSEKADSLYKYCDDREIIAACRKLGLREDEASLVRLRAEKYHHLRAVGTTGKRSVMLAAAVAIVLDGGFAPGLKQELKDYKLDKAFRALLGQAWWAKQKHDEFDLKPKPQRVVSVKQEKQESDEEPETRAENRAEIRKALAEEGVEIQVVCTKVPVVGMTKDSAFQEHVSWLVQTATDFCGKADAVYDYCSDRKILAECMELGLTEQEVGLVQLKSERHNHVKAVGTCGKRSILLAIVVALVLEKQVKPSFLLEEVRGYDRELERAVKTLLKGIMGLSGHSRHEVEDNDDGWSSWTGSTGGKNTSSHFRYEAEDDDDEGWGSWKGSTGGKRKASDDARDYGSDGWGNDNGSGWKAWSSKSSKSSKKKAASKSGHHDEKSLDRQLADYWGDDD